MMQDLKARSGIGIHRSSYNHQFQLSRYRHV